MKQGRLLRAAVVGLLALVIGVQAAVPAPPPARPAGRLIAEGPIATPTPTVAPDGDCQNGQCGL